MHLAGDISQNNAKTMQHRQLHYGEFCCIILNVFCRWRTAESRSSQSLVVATANALRYVVFLDKIWCVAFVTAEPRVLPGRETSIKACNICFTHTAQQSWSLCVLLTAVWEFRATEAHELVRWLSKTSVNQREGIDRGSRLAIITLHFYTVRG